MTPIICKRTTAPTSLGTKKLRKNCRHRPRPQRRHVPDEGPEIRDPEDRSRCPTFPPQKKEEAQWTV